MVLVKKAHLHAPLSSSWVYCFCNLWNKNKNQRIKTIKVKKTGRKSSNYLCFVVDIVANWINFKQRHRFYNIIMYSSYEIIYKFISCFYIPIQLYNFYHWKYIRQYPSTNLRYFLKKIYWKQTHMNCLFLGELEIEEFRYFLKLRQSVKEISFPKICMQLPAYKKWLLPSTMFRIVGKACSITFFLYVCCFISNRWKAEGGNVNQNDYKMFIILIL